MSDNERKALRIRLLQLGGSISACWEKSTVGKFDQERAELAVDVAVDDILAAGYRKPRTVESVEELDALAEGSVILSNRGEDSAQKDGEGYWYLWGGDIGLCPEEIALPATVLHNPDEQL